MTKSPRVTIYAPCEGPCYVRKKYADVETCSVVNQFCISPANQEYPKRPAKAKCFRCGMPVCVQCSTRRKYLIYGIQRICDNCQEEMGDGGLVEQRYIKRAARS